MKKTSKLVVIGMLIWIAGLTILDIKTKLIRKYYNYKMLSKEEVLGKAKAFSGTEEFLLYHNHCTGKSGISMFQPWGDMVLVTDVKQWDFKKTKQWMWNDKMGYCDVNHPYLAMVWEKEGKRFEAMWSFEKDGFTFEKTPLWLEFNPTQSEAGIFENPQYFISNKAEKNGIGKNIKEVTTTIAKGFYNYNPMRSFFKPTDTLIVTIDMEPDKPYQKKVFIGKAINAFFSDTSKERGLSNFAKIVPESIHANQYWVRLLFEYDPKKTLYLTSIQIRNIPTGLRLFEMNLKLFKKDVK